MRCIVLKIANYVSVGRYKSGGILGLGSKQIIIEDKAFWEAAVLIINKWINPNTIDGIKILITKEYPSIDQGTIDKIINMLVEKNFLIDDDVYCPNDRFSRSKLYYNYTGGEPKKVQSNLENSSVTIIGCGGIGNHVSVILATSGVKKITLIDPDVIELSNLTRQVLFKENDIGKYKVDVLKRELLNRNRELEIITRYDSIESKNDIMSLPNTDLYIISADYPKELIDWANEACVVKKQAYVASGYINDIAVIGPFYIPNKTACFNCNRFVPDFYDDDPLKLEILSIDSIFKPATFAPVNNISAAFVANDIIKYLGNFGNILSVNRRIGIHTNNIKIETQEYKINKECPICQKN